MFSLQALLDGLAPCRQAPAWRLGLSGGLDSMVLLHALCELRQTHPLPPLSAIHVHHGLHPDADRWAELCQTACGTLKVALHIERVTLDAGASVENAARNSRYQAFENLLGPGEILLLAHHRDDQVETIMFRLLRGTGLRGLGGMPVTRSVGQGRLYRPLLSFQRSELTLWARSRGLSWVEDPANRDPRFARTLLRHDALPRLRQAWPMLDASLLRLAGHADQALELLDERAAEDWHEARAGADDPWLQAWPSLSVETLLGLSLARQSNLLRYWLHRQGCRLPDEKHLQQLLSQLQAASDSQPSMPLDGRRLLRSAGRLWLLPGSFPSPVEQRVRPASSVSLGDNGRLCFEPGDTGLRAVNGVWTVRYRQGGEAIRLAGRPTQSLKQLLQGASIPVWLRERVPLLYCDGRLASVAGRWHAEEATAAPGETGWQVRWEP